MVKDEKARFMRAAVKEALKGQALDESSRSAQVIVLGGKIISRAFNKKETLGLCTAHAEIRAIEKAEKNSARGISTAPKCTLRWSLALCARGR